MLRAARFEVARRGGPPHIAVEAADAALINLRAHLSDFRGDRRFTTWASKFALLEAAVKLRRRAWEGRELPDGEPPELRRMLRGADSYLTPHQRRVLVAVVLHGVPIDVLAERLATTRGALYTTLRDARRTLRRHVTSRSST